MTFSTARQVIATLRMALPFLLLLALSATEVSPYEKSVEEWRQKYEAKLRADDGWLTVSGLFWMHDGENRFGSAPDNDVVLPLPVPAQAGHFDLYAGKTTVHVNPGVPITMGGQPVESAELRPDSRKDRLVIGDLTFFVHQSAGRFAIRLKDKNSKLRREFLGLHWFPVDESYRVTAHFNPYESPREVEIETILGDHEKTKLAGYVTFSLHGKEYRLDAEEDDDTHGLFIVFRDLTSKKDTYPAARFLDTALPSNGAVELDFNKAYNPPCAYNPYATCPLPTPGNRLPIELPVGEKRYHQ
jgi:uncharacterized protein